MTGTGIGQDRGTAAPEMRRLYILRTDFSSPQQRESTKKIDDTHEEITLKWGPDMRRRISEVRNKQLNKMRKNALNFYGLLVVRESDREDILRLSEEADKAMHELSPDLGAKVRFIALYLEDEARGEVYQQVLGAIQGRIYGKLFGRLKELAKMEEIPARSRTALIKLCDRLQKWNVIDDPNITQALADIKLQFENDVFKPVLNDLAAELQSLRERGAFLEFDSEAAPADAADEPQSDSEPEPKPDGGNLPDGPKASRLDSFIEMPRA